MCVGRNNCSHRDRPAMDEEQIAFFITNNLKSKTYFVGVFASDEINTKICKLRPFNRVYNYCFIVNTIPRMQTGMGHWLCFHLAYNHSQKCVTLKFFDSFNLPFQSYNRDINKFITLLKQKCFYKNIKFDIDTLKHSIQHPLSLLCGAYVCFGVIQLELMDPNTKLETVFKCFKKHSHKINDRAVGRYVNKLWPVRSCFSSNKLPNLPRFYSTTQIAPPFCPKLQYGYNECLSKCVCSFMNKTKN